VRLVTLVGAAGVGKTRLAVEVARRSAAGFAGGATFVPFADVRDVAAVPHALLTAMGVADAGSRPPLAVLAELLGEQRTLLVIDNMEHLVDAAPDLAVLVDACPSLTVLATSRRPLAIRAERCVQVDPMPVPESAAISATQALQHDAVALLASRLEAADSRFRLDDADVPVVVGICGHLDGLPLALELAAARARSLSLPAILDALQSRRLPLTGGARDQPARQRTMADAVRWSYELLDARTAAVFRRLGVCIGGTTLDGAAALAADLDLGGVGLLDVVDELVAHSLVERVAGGARYRMLEVVREFAAEQLASSGEEVAARRRHAQHFLAVAEAAATRSAGPEQAVWLDRLHAESPNLAAAVRCAVELGDAAVALRLCLALRLLWYVRGPLAEGRALFAAALSVHGAEPALRARALVEASTLARHHGDFGAARALVDEGLAIARSGDVDDDDLLAAALLHQGFVLHLTGEYAGARTALEQSLAMRQRMGDMLGVARAAHHLGLVASFGDGDLALAWEMQVRCLALFRELGNQRHAATALIAMTELARARGELRRARELLGEALAHVSRLDDTPLLVYALHHAASLAADESHPLRAVRLLGAAEGLERSSGAAPWPAVAAASRRWLPAVERRLGARRVAGLRATGARLGAVDAIALAEAAQDDGDDPLTRREHEIAALVAGGLTNRAIAERLVVSERTVDGHVARILDKLEFSSRAQIAAWVAAGDAVAAG
jgi:non-specific serine/threonine protein kinase